jgi:hypothetical protein
VQEDKDLQTQDHRELVVEEVEVEVVSILRTDPVRQEMVEEVDLVEEVGEVQGVRKDNPVFHKEMVVLDLQDRLVVWVVQWPIQEVQGNRGPMVLEQVREVQEVLVAEET